MSTPQNFKLMLTCTITLACSLVAFATRAQSVDETTIRKNRQDSNAGIANKDATVIASFWLDDFTIIRGNGVRVTGKPANVKVWTDTFTKTPQALFIRNPIEVVVSAQNEMAWETGEWEGKNTYSKGGKYSAMWRKVDGNWKLQAELFVALK